VEEEIDRIDHLVPSLNSFIMPGGHTVVSYCHIARSICRRAERRLIPVLQIDDVPGAAAMKFLNRLSDYLFILSRKIASDLNCEEKIWNQHP
jgi:cob(I)alamin adenosyltransferase